MPCTSAETNVPAYGMALLATAAVGLLAAGAHRTLKVARKASHGIKFSYSIQKDAYADLEFMNDVGCSEFLVYWFILVYSLLW